MDTFKRHIQSHFGESKFSCEFCGKNFGRPDSLKRHQKLHNVLNLTAPVAMAVNQHAEPNAPGMNHLPNAPAANHLPTGMPELNAKEPLLNSFLCKVQISLILANFSLFVLLFFLDYWLHSCV